MEVEDIMKQIENLKKILYLV
jgi:ABC-type multidrug transport system ATPase subunit